MHSMALHIALVIITQHPKDKISHYCSQYSLLLAARIGSLRQYRNLQLLPQEPGISFKL